MVNFPPDSSGIGQAIHPFMLMVRGDVQPYGSAPRSLNFSKQERIYESLLGSHGFAVHCGPLKSSTPLCVKRDGGEPMFSATRQGP